MTTRVDEIADGLYRLSTFVPEVAAPAGMVFNQFLVVRDEPLLFHTGLRRLFPLVREAVGRVLPPQRLRWVSYGHFEADECGALNDWLAVAAQAGRRRRRGRGHRRGGEGAASVPVHARLVQVSPPATIERAIRRAAAADVRPDSRTRLRHAA